MIVVFCKIVYFFLLNCRDVYIFFELVKDKIRKRGERVGIKIKYLWFWISFEDVSYFMY